MAHLSGRADFGHSPHMRVDRASLVAADIQIVSNREGSLRDRMTATGPNIPFFANQFVLPVEP